MFNPASAYDEVSQRRLLAQHLRGERPCIGHRFS
jgi:hypothetical protein